MLTCERLVFRNVSVVVSQGDGLRFMQLCGLAMGFGFGAFELDGSLRKRGNLIETLVTRTEILTLHGTENGLPSLLCAFRSHRMTISRTILNKPRGRAHAPL